MARARLRRFFRHGFLPQLIAFEACVRLGSVTRAAQELSLAQPTVSGMLRKLGDAMGGPVVVMRNRRIEPSDIGRELMPLCADLFDAFDRFEARRAAGPGYDLGVDSLPISPWPSSSPTRNRSRWRQRASQCQRARKRPPAAAGEL
jgi:hypothetical protein